MKKFILLILAVSVALPVAAKRPKRVEHKEPEVMKIVLDSAKIVGYIHGYNPSYPFKTGELSRHNPFSGESLPQVFLIADNGTFEVEFPVWFPSQVTLNIGGLLFTPYVEPGVTLNVMLGTDPVKKKIVMAYNGALARENDEIDAFERTDVPWAQRSEAYKSDDWRATDKLFRPVMNDNLRRLDEALAADSISKKVYDFLRYKELMHYAEDMLSRKQYVDDAPTPPEYYAFMREIPFDDPGFIAVSDWVIPNRIEFMGPMRQDYYKQFTGMGPDEFLESRGAKLTDEEKNSFFYRIGEDKEVIEKRQNTVDSLKKTYPTLFEDYNKYWESIPIPPSGADKDRQFIAYADSVWHSLTGRKSGLMMDIVAMNLLDDIQREAANLSPSRIVQHHRAIYDLVEHPFLRDEVWRHYEQMLPKMGGRATELPEGPAADILHGILDKFKGKPVLVDFWGTGCGPCVATLKGNKEDRAKVEAKGDVTLVYITDPSWSPNETHYKQFCADNALTNSYRLTGDEWNLIAALLKISSVPRYVLFDAETRIIDDHYNGHSMREFL
jgi:thiol-disulfide isomerase/thioredoxin